MSEGRSKDRLFEGLIWLLIGAGLVALLAQAAQMPSRELLSTIRRIIAVSALPVGIGVKLGKWLLSERERMVKVLSDAQQIASSNQQFIEANREAIAELQTQLRELDKALIRLEVRVGLGGRIEMIQAQLSELSDRFNRFLTKS